MIKQQSDLIVKDISEINLDLSIELRVNNI